MTTSATARPLSGGLITLMASAIGIIVANLYYVQPLLHQIRGDFHVSTSSAASLMTLTQVGYAAGLAFVVPLGDLIRRRRLVVAIFCVAALTMAVASFLSSFAPFAVVTFFIGLSSVGGQVIVPFAADLADELNRGRIIAQVMTGLILGILLSRTVSGLIAQFAGWRAVYWFATVLVAFAAVVLHFVLPDEPLRPRVKYHHLVVGSFSLLATVPVLRRRAWFGALIFAVNSAFWTTLSFHLSAAPFHYSNGIIGFFGLFGVAGVIGANFAGHHADRSFAARTTLVASILMLGSAGVLWLGRASFLGVALVLVLLEGGMQGLQITNQSVIYKLLPDARSRVNSAYMVCCFTGASIGSYAAGELYARYQWGGVCLLGVALGLGLTIPAALRRSASAAN